MSRIEFQNKIMVVADEFGSDLLKQARKAAASDASVLICGESGTGKELVARYIHSLGSRDGKPFVAINCSAVPEGMMEAELFGFERGAFTGAFNQRIGKMEEASGGTLLLDEVTEMPFSIQAKLLRALQECEIDRLGGKNTIKLDVRVIATSNQDPIRLIESGNLRSDLFYRLNVLRLDCPPLRGRFQAIHSLLNHFMSLNQEKYGRHNISWTRRAIEGLKAHSWPGNVRELANVVERALVFSDKIEIDLEDIQNFLEQPKFNDSERSQGERLEDLEKNQIQKTLLISNGNKTEAARKLGISVRTLHNKLKTYGQRV